MNNTLNSAYKQAAIKLCVDQKLVESVYKSYWGFMKNHVSKLALRHMSEEEFSSVDTNFNIPYIGKLYVDYNKIEKYNRKLKFYENVKAKKNKANWQSDIDK